MPGQWFRVAAACGCLVAVAVTGCASRKAVIQPVENVPRELKKASQPEYVIEPPDVLQVDLIAAVPKPPYKLQPLDAISVRVPQAPADAPLSGLFQVELDGTVNLGALYGTVPVVGLTVPEAREAIEKALTRVLVKPTAEVTLAQGRGLQQVRGPHLVRGDGTIGLGTYGSVRVVGMTIPDAKRTIEAYLSAYFQNPEISLDVTGFNSKVYYLVFDGGNAGTQVTRLPLTGNETVLDALSNAGGLPQIGDPRKVWVARPTVDGCPSQIILPVDWACITSAGDTRTNYQLMAGDRVFVQAYRATAFNNKFSRAIAPVERVLGAVLLGTGVYRQFNNLNNNNNGNNNGGF